MAFLALWNNQRERQKLTIAFIYIYIDIFLRKKIVRSFNEDIKEYTSLSWKEECLLTKAN